MSATIEDELVRVDFDRYDPNAYEMFMRVKALPERRIAYDVKLDRYTVTTPKRFAPILGLDAGRAENEGLGVAEHLFDYQRFIVERAVEARRYAVWADTGLGKTAIFLEWARQVRARTDGGILIVSPPQVIEQTRAESIRFYRDEIPILRLRTRAELAGWCGTPGVAITNYEKFIPGVMPELRLCSGVVLDESSILKTGGGTIKWNVIHSSRGIPWKLSCTATPAPNDTMEYASQAAFLECLRSEGEILWTWFSRNKYGVWSIKPHAKRDFYRFMASWSIYLRNPAHYGFADILSTLPDPIYHEEPIKITEAQRNAMADVLVGAKKGLFDERLGVRERAKLSQIAKGFMYDAQRKPHRIESRKPTRVAEIVHGLDDPTIIWTVFNEESEILCAELGGVRYATLSGETPDDEREQTISDFKAGDVDVLISKAQLVGYGLNFQTARSMVFSGLTDSYEQMYQAIRRAYRFGQTHAVHVYVPFIPELEGMVMDNLARKRSRVDSEVEECERSYREALL